MTINNPDTGDEMDKSAMYVDANIHGNEVQGGEVGIYTIWYLMENYPYNDYIRELVDERVFYIFPCVNPDGRDLWLHKGGSARSGQAPVDDDNDGDGRYNEDQGGGYDPNRDWGSYWQPPYIQRGAGAYPFYWKESKLTRDFLYDHPNIAGVQAFHNSGGMILRVPGAQLHGEVPRSDKAVYDEIGEKGEKIIEGYDYYVIWKDLYTVWGGFIDFTYDMLRIHSFSNEIWTSRADLDGDREITEEEEEFFDRYIDMGNKEIAMHEIDHPQLGKVIIDLDRTKLSGRVPPSWLLEELCHRNMAFCLLHAYEMPLPKIKKVSAEKVSSDLYKVKVSISNGRLMPTLSAQAIESQVQRPDVLSVQGDVDVLAAGQSQGTGLPAGIPRRYLRYFRGMGAADSDVNLIEQKDPTRLKLFNGIPGRTEVEYQFLIKGKGKVTVELDCLKGGTHTKDLELK